MSRKQKPINGQSPLTTTKTTTKRQRRQQQQSSLYVGCPSNQEKANKKTTVCLLVGCSDNSTCRHTEIEVADPTFHLTQSQYTDTGPTSPSTDPTTPGAWKGSHRSTKFLVIGMTRPRKKISAQAGFEPGIFRSRADALTTRPTRWSKTTEWRFEIQRHYPCDGWLLVVGRLKPQQRACVSRGHIC